MLRGHTPQERIRSTAHAHAHGVCPLESINIKRLQGDYGSLDGTRRRCDKFSVILILNLISIPHIMDGTRARALSLVCGVHWKYVPVCVCWSGVAGEDRVADKCAVYLLQHAHVDHALTASSPRRRRTHAHPRIQNPYPHPHPHPLSC